MVLLSGGFVSGHDFSRAAICYKINLGFSPRGNARITHLLRCKLQRSSLKERIL